MARVKDYFIESGVDDEASGRTKITGRRPSSAAPPDIHKLFMTGAQAIHVKYKDKTVWYRRVEA